MLSPPRLQITASLNPTGSLKPSRLDGSRYEKDGLAPKMRKPPSLFLIRKETINTKLCLKLPALLHRVRCELGIVLPQAHLA